MFYGNIWLPKFLRGGADRKTYKDILKGPFFRYVVIFSVWTTVYIIWSYSLTDLTESFLKFAVVNSEGWHLWYLKVYLQILIVYPFVSIITQNEKLTVLYSVLWFAFIGIKFTAGCLPFFSFEILRLVQLPFFQYSGYIGGTVIGYFPMECLGLFIMGGYCIEKMESRKLSKCRRYFVPAYIISVLITAAIAYALTNKFEQPFDAGLNPLQSFVFIETVCFIGTVYVIGDLVRRQKIKRTFAWLSDQTLGVYIIHPFLKELCLRCFRHWGISESYGRNMVLYIMILVLSFMLTAGVHSIFSKRASYFIF